MNYLKSYSHWLSVILAVVFLVGGFFIIGYFTKWVLCVIIGVLFLGLTTYKVYKNQPW
jgi:uncharacterized protein involved in cysteine biosynthesis